MSFERTQPWFRALTVFLAATSVLLLPAEGQRGALAQESPRQLFDAGVTAYKLVELERAEQQLLRAAELLRASGENDPDARRLGAQVQLYLGRVTLVADKPEQARAHFRKALELDPSLVMVTETDPPRIVEAFEAARADLVSSSPGPAPEPSRAAPPTPAAAAAARPTPAAEPKRKKRWIWWALGGAAVAAAGIVALGAGGGGSGDDVSLAGGWTISALEKVTSSCGDPDYVPGLDSGDLSIAQNGSHLTMMSCCLDGMLGGNVEGSSMDFSGQLSTNDGACLTTEGYSGSGSVSGSRIDGEFQMHVNRTPLSKTSRKPGDSALPPCPFQCDFKFSYTMRRL